MPSYEKSRSKIGNFNLRPGSKGIYNKWGIPNFTRHITATEVSVYDSWGKFRMWPLTRYQVLFVKECFVIYVYARLSWLHNREKFWMRFLKSIRFYFMKNVLVFMWMLHYLFEEKFRMRFLKKYQVIFPEEYFVICVHAKLCVNWYWWKTEILRITIILKWFLKRTNVKPTAQVVYLGKLVVDV